MKPDLLEREAIAENRQPSAWDTLARWLIAAAVLAVILFAHGCHGDEDHELFTALMMWVK